MSGNMEEELVLEGFEESKRAYKALKNVDDVPTSKTQLTHDWMQDYVFAKHPEDFKELFDWENAHQVIFKSNLRNTGGFETSKTDIKAMREWFLKKYAKEFPMLSKKKPITKKESNTDRASRLLAMLEEKKKDQKKIGQMQEPKKKKAQNVARSSRSKKTSE